MDGVSDRVQSRDAYTSKNVNFGMLAQMERGGGQPIRIRFPNSFFPFTNNIYNLNKVLKMGGGCHQFGSPSLI